MRFSFSTALLCSLLLSLNSRLDAADSVHWSLDRSPQAAGNPPGVKLLGGESLAYSDDVPGAWIYDPITQKSRKNSAGASFSGDRKKSQPLLMELDPEKFSLADRSLTLEIFVKPSPEAGGDAWLFGKTRSSETGSELSLELHELRNHHQTWHGAAVAPPGKHAIRWPAGHYSSSTRLSSEDKSWRHAALVYDAPSRTVTCFVDYHLIRSTKLDQPLAFDAGPLAIGGLVDKWGVNGLLDEPRLTLKALGPVEFLRARADSIQGVSFVSKQEIVPRDAGCFDVKEHFGAAGDGKTDDTAAFNAAFRHLTSKVPLAYNTLVIPPGTYLLSDVVQCSRFIDVKGAGPDKTILKLKDGVFTDIARPLPVLRMSSTFGAPGSHRGVNGSSICLYLDGVTINTGKNNPGGKALEYHSNNVGRLENVVLRSDDGQGAVGLDLTHHDVGPALVKHVRIEGFDYGITINYQEYSMTFEHVQLNGQRVAGILNRGNILAIRGLHSENQVPAIIAEGANSMISLLDSKLTGGKADQPAIRSQGALYALRVETQGYKHAVEKRVLTSQTPPQWEEKVVDGPKIEEYVGDQVVRGFGKLSGALKLPIEETPEPPLPPVAEWVSVAKFADRKVGDDAAPVLQAAVDSGAKVLYIPRDFDLQLHTPVRLHGVQRIMGFGGQLQWSNADKRDDKSPPPPLLIFDETKPDHVTILDRLGCQHLQHASPATLVLKSSSAERYTTAAAGGKLFAEDVGGADWHFDHPQRVWVRQWNPESHSPGPCIESKGAVIWALGFKTEYESQKLRATDGAQTEILGSFIYPLGKIPPDRPIFENRDSRMCLVYGTSVYHANHQLHILDVMGTQERKIGNEQLRWAGSRARMDLFISVPEPE